LRKSEKVKGNWRVEFVCGYRALRAARLDAGLFGESARLLSCGPAEVPSMLERALDERQATHRARQRLTEELAELQALMLLATDRRPGRAGGPGIVCKVLENQDAAYMRMIATKIVGGPGMRVLLATREGHVIFAQSTGLDADMNALLRECLTAAGGKGGGTHDFAQGSVGQSADVARILEQAMARLSA
jgi:alanyl-tRNA synthetase